MKQAQPRFLRVLLLSTVVLGFGTSLAAGDWSIDLQPVYMDVSGHDQHALTIHDSGGATSQVGLVLDAGPAYRFGLQLEREKWSWGMDFLWFTTQQKTPDRSVAAAGPGQPVVFEIADRQYTSTGSDEVLFYRLLEDNDLNIWTLDFYAMRPLGEKGNVDLILGLRSADFDNDVRSAVGVDGVEGTRQDSSSNYDRMTGPLVAVAWHTTRGKNSFDAYLGLSVVFGDAQVSAKQTDFEGAFSDPLESRTDIREFTKAESVTLPITEVRFDWSYDVSDHWSLGLGLHVSAWSDMPVPPGIDVNKGFGATQESTLVFSGVVGSVKVKI